MVSMLEKFRFRMISKVRENVESEKTKIIKCIQSEISNFAKLRNVYSFRQHIVTKKYIKIICRQLPYDRHRDITSLKNYKFEFSQKYQKTNQWK